MKAIVVRQPWATLIALGVKSLETRPGPPNGPMRPKGVRGLPGCALERGERIAIVAGATTGTIHDRIVKHRAAWQALADATATPWGSIAPVELGAVVCTVTVDDALPVTGEDGDENGAPFLAVDSGTLRLWQQVDYLTNEWDELGYDDQLPLGDFAPGRWGWLLSDPMPCDPIPCKGRQGVFELPADVAGALA